MKIFGRNMIFIITFLTFLLFLFLLKTEQNCQI